MPTRTYIKATDEAQRAVAEIARLVRGGFVDPTISFDVETMPIAGLEGYPGTSFDDDGERIKPAKKHYLIYAQERWADSFNPDYLARLNLRVPRKTTAGNERPGVPAKVAWQEFWQAVQLYDDRALAQARWTSKEAVLGYQIALEQAIAEQEATIEQFSGVKGKKKVVEAAKVELEHLQWKLTRIPTMLARVEQPLDLKLLRHIVAVGVENRVKVDPVRPGLDPFTSDIFTVQITLRRTLDRELLTWVFNTALIPMEELRAVFKLGRAYTYLAHNAKFDLKMLMAKLGLDAAPRNVFCTRIGSRMLYLGLRMSHALKAVAMRFTGQKMDKGVRDTFIGQRRLEPTQEQIDYGAFDTEVLFDIYDKMMKSAQDRGQVSVLREFSKLSWITAKWELDGYLVDAEKWLAIAAQAAADRDDLAKQIEDLLLPAGYAELLGGGLSSQDDLEALTELENEAAFSDDEDKVVDVRHEALIRVSQTALVCERLVQVLGQKVADKAFPDGKTSLKKDARGAWERAYRELNGGETHPFFRLYELWAKRAKQASTYGVRFLWAVHPLTGAIHPSLNIAGTDTGRYSSTVPNMLNVPAAKEEGDPDFRGAFIAPGGFLFLGADFEAMEMRIAFCITEDAVGKKMIESGKDAHSFTAAMAFHIRKAKVSAVRKVTDKFKYGTTTLEIDVYEVPESWTAVQVADFALTDEVVASVGAVPKKATRTVAKTITFLYLFGGMAYTLAVRTGLPLEQCEDFFARFEAVYVGLSAGMAGIRAAVMDTIIEGHDGKFYAWSGAYGGLRRWFELPENPSRWMYPDGWAGDSQFNRAQYDYKRRIRKMQREAGNVPCQGGNAYITACALNAMVEEGHPQGIYPWLAIYDEVIVVFPETAEPKVAKGLLEHNMLDAAGEWMTFVQAGAEADLKKVSKCWVKS